MTKAATKPTVRNPITEEQAKAAAIAPVYNPAKMDLDRVKLPKARDSELIMQPDGHRCAHVEFWLRPDLTLEDALEPEFWSQVAYKFTRPISSEGNYAGSIIELRAQDLSFYAELFVRVVSKTGLQVVLLRSHKIGLQKVVAPGYTVRWNAHACGYDLIRDSDRQLVGRAKDFPTKERAQAWLDRNS